MSEPIVDYGCCRHEESSEEACQCGCSHAWRREPECVLAYVTSTGQIRCGECCIMRQCSEHLYRRNGCPTCGGSGVLTGSRLAELWPDSGGRIVVWPRDLDPGM